jgi:cell wall-associated NlpC family hydrolase
MRRSSSSSRSLLAIVKRALLFVLLAAVPSAVAAAPAAGATTTTVTASTSSPRINLGRAARINGTVKTGGTGVPGQVVSLVISPYPFKSSTSVSKTTETGGKFSFRITPDRRTHYRVTSGDAHSDRLGIEVRALIHTHVRLLPLGRVTLSATIHHPSDLHWSGRSAVWRLAGPNGRPYRGVAHSTTSDVHPGLTRLALTIPVPAGNLAFLACFRAPDDHAMVTGGGQCGGVSVTQRFRAPEGFPSPSRVARAGAYLSHRRGRTAFAVVDSEGRMSGVHIHWRFVSASVVKAMLLVSYLRKLDAEHRGLDGGSRSILYPMIHVSDNNAATAVWRRVGDPALRRLAQRAGMTDFSISGIWARAQISAADQARFFFDMDSLVPHQFRGYARYLLSHISGAQSWGIPSVGRPHYAVFFKGGWRGTVLGQLVHQIARLERGPLRFSLAVMTDGDPSMGYGIGTIRGVASRLF